jgi:hypothetical protein
MREPSVRCWTGVDTLHNHADLPAETWQSESLRLMSPRTSHRQWSLQAT